MWNGKVIIIGLRAIAYIARAFRVPIMVVALVGVALCLPQQVIEIYRALAEDLFLAKYTSQLGPKLELASSVMLGVLCVTSIWYTARSIAYQSYARAPLVARPAFAHLPKVLAAIPIACLAFGIYRSTATTGTPDADHAVLRILSYMFPDDPKPVLEVIKNEMLDYNRDATLIAIVAAALVLFLPARTHQLSKHAASVRSGPDELFSRPVRLICYGAAVALVLLVVQFRVAAPQIMGALGILFAFVAIVTPLLAHIAFLSGRHRVPYLTILAGVVLAISALDLNDNHALYRPAATNDAPAGPGVSLQEAEVAFRDWFRQRPDLEKYEKAGRPYPVYVVAAEGGGIYAAFHAASVLGGVQDQCPAFADHLFAISSVSGGSLGAATFAAGLKYAQAAEWPSAKNGACVEAEPPQPRAQSLVNFSDAVLSRDLLSPLAAGLMFPDMLQALLPVRFPSLDRTRNFEAAFEAALDQTIAEMQAGDAHRATAGNFFRSPVVRHWTPSARTPALVMNTTEVGSGRIRVIAPFVFNRDHVLFLPFGDAELAMKVGESLDDLSVATAAITTARFPWVTPAGAFFDWSSAPQSGSSDQRKIDKVRLVDGGYFENSGVATAMELISGMQAAAWKYGFAEKMTIRLIVLTKGGFPRQEFYGLSELISPVIALLSARSSRAPLIIDQIERALRERTLMEAAPSINISTVNLQDLYYPLPLGWRLSLTSLIFIQAQNGMPDRCKADDAGLLASSAFGADCLVLAVKRELN
jgi:hypothetical protein